MLELLFRLSRMVDESGWGGVVTWALVTFGVGLLIQLAFITIGGVARWLHRTP